VGLHEGSWDAGDVVFGDARPIVLDVKINLVLESLRADGDETVGLREFDGVAQQRRQDALHRRDIAGERLG